MNKQQFVCMNGFEHRMGQNAVDSGHGARPTGPQICLNCKKTLAELIDQYAYEYAERVKAEGKIEAALHLKKYMISTSPFISRIVDPYIEEQLSLKGSYHDMICGCPACIKLKGGISDTLRGGARKTKLSSHKEEEREER